jgi:hypothetical protein
VRNERQAVTDELFWAVVDLTGLTPLLAPGTVRRALRDVGITPTEATAVDMLRALPCLKARLAAFLSEEEVARHAQRIESFLRSRPR